MLRSHRINTDTGQRVIFSWQGQASDLRLELSSAVAEYEAEGLMLEEIVFCCDGWHGSGPLTGSAGDSGLPSWLCEALDWARDHGRRVVLQTAKLLPRAWVAPLADGSAVVELCLAHRNVAIQRALLGPQADSLADLLLQAQFLAAVGVELRAHLAPLLAGLHDLSGGFEPLLQSIRAADIQRVSLAIARLNRPQVDALRDCLDLREYVAVARAYGIDGGLAQAFGLPAQGGDGQALRHEQIWQVSPRAEISLLHGFAEMVRDAELRLRDDEPSRGTPDENRLVYRSVLPQELFATSPGRHRSVTAAARPRATAVARPLRNVRRRKLGSRQLELL